MSITILISQRTISDNCKLPGDMTSKSDPGGQKKPRLLWPLLLLAIQNHLGHA